MDEGAAYFHGNKPRAKGVSFLAEHEPMMDMFIFETRQFLEQLEQRALASEQSQSFNTDDVNEIFRAMHTIKGSAAMMMVNEVSSLAHAVEDIFYYIREKHPKVVDSSAITDLILSAVDFMRSEIDTIDEGGKAVESSADLREATRLFLRAMKEANGDDPDVDLRKVKKNSTEVLPDVSAKPQHYYISAAKAAGVPTGTNVYAAKIFFDEGCEMEEVRAYAVLNAMEEKTGEIHYKPEKLLEDDHAVEDIRMHGFRLWFTTDLPYLDVEKQLSQTIFLKKLELKQLKDISECEYWPSAVQKAVNAVADAEPVKPVIQAETRPALSGAGEHHDAHESQMISVKVDKLDRLMDLVGELVIAEAMVTQNPDLNGLELDNFQKAARQLHKINGELQDSVMAIRMVPLEGTFRKMNRIVRDMTKKLGKKAQLVLVGESTEVDKNIIEHISDPLMHIIRNSIDHGIEMPEERKAKGKAETGKVTLTAENAGGEVVLRIIDDGAGLNREKILERARANHLFTKPEAELTDQEIYSFIFAAGFSTKEKVTEFSGRGVGMDVVVQNIKSLGGSVLVDSIPGHGSTTTLKIPLTLAIIQGMSVAVGKNSYTIPITSIRQSFRPSEGDVFADPDGSEMIMVRGQCYPIVRLGRLYHVEQSVADLTEGILILVETGKKIMGIFADRLIGVQEIVVKPVPQYIQQVSHTDGITGCTLLGDGSISLILDAQRLGNEIYT